MKWISESNSDTHDMEEILIFLTCDEIYPNIIFILQQLNNINSVLWKTKNPNYNQNIWAN